MDNFVLWFSSVAVSTTLASFVMWLTKSWISERLKNAIKNEYDQKLETHKAQLKAQAEVEAERLRTAAAEHQIRFAKLHEKRGDVIATLHALMVKAHSEAKIFVLATDEFDEPTVHDRYRGALLAIEEFLQYFEKHRIYLPQNICTMLENFPTEIKGRTVRLWVYARHAKNGSRMDINEMKQEFIESTWDYLETELPKTRAALEHEFRTMLGAT